MKTRVHCGQVSLSVRVSFLLLKKSRSSSAMAGSYSFNEPDMAELPPEVEDGMRFVPVHRLEEVLKVALPRKASPT